MQYYLHNDPFPHVIAHPEEEIYDYAKKQWETIEHKNHSLIAGNRSNVPVTDVRLYKTCREMLLEIYPVFSQAFAKNYAKLMQTGFELDAKVLFSENISSKKDYKIRGWHLDTGEKFFIGLWYFRDEEETDSYGGDLLLMNPETKEIKKVEYARNTLIIFPNIPQSWHAITPRKASPYKRRYINMMLVSDTLKLHNYEREADGSEFRGTLANHYK